MKKFLLIVLILFVVLVGVVAALPFVVDVNKYRDEITQQIEKQVNAKAKLGEIHLTVLKGLGLKISNFALTPNKGNDQKQPIVEVGKVDLFVPWHRLLFSPVVNVKVDSPLISVVQRKDGTMNVTELPKGTDTAAAAPAPESKEPTKLPSFVQKASVNVSLVNGTILFHNAQGQKVELKPLNVEMKDISLSKEMTMRVSLDMNIQSKEPPLEVAGSVMQEFRLKPELTSDGTKLKSLTINGTVDLTQLGFSVRPMLKKKRGENLTLALEGHYQDPQFELKHFGLKIGKSVVSLHGTANLANASEPQLNFVLDVSPLLLREATTWISGVGDADGALKAHTTIKGTPSALQIVSDAELKGKNIKPEGATLAISDISIENHLSAQLVKTQAGYSATSVSLTVPQLFVAQGKESIQGKMSVKGNEKAADLRVEMSSAGFNVDALTGPPASGGTGGGGGVATGGGGKGAEPAPMPLPERLKMLDDQLKSLKQIAVLKNSTGVIDLKFKNLLASGLKFNRFHVLAIADKLDFKLKELSMEIFGGTVDMNGGLNLRGSQPDVAGKIAIRSLDLEPATQFAAPSLKGLVSGQLQMDGSMSTRGILWENVNKNLTGNVKAEIKNGQLSTIPIGKWVREAVGKVKMLESVAGKMNTSKEYGDKIKALNATVAVSGGVANLNPVTMEYTTGDIGFNGAGTVDFAQNLNFAGTALASPSLLPVPELKGPDGRTQIPLRFKGSLSSPQVDYAYTVEELSKRYAKSKANALIQSQAQKVLQQPEVKKVIEQPKVQEGINKLFKKKLF